MKKRKITLGGYFLLSIGVSVLIIHTALPYYCLTSIAFPGWNIYWSYADVQKRMFILFPMMSFLGALSTIKKRVNFEDVFLNVSAPVIWLLFLKVLQYHAVLAIGTMLFAGIIFGYVWSRFSFRNKKVLNRSKKVRLIYYGCRRRIIYVLLVTFTPMVIWVNYQESEQSEKYLVAFKSLQSERASEQQNIELNIANEEQWKQLNAEERFLEMTKLVDYECNKLHVGSIDVFAIKEITDGRLGYYDSNAEAVYINVAYLNNSCSLPEAVHIIAHECYHRYTDKVIESLTYLEEAGMNYEALEYYHDAVVLKEAASTYYLDSLEYDTYNENELERQAEQYADTEVELLKEKFEWG